MNKKTLTQITASALFTVPLFAYAATVIDVLNGTSAVLNRVIPILMVVATIVFLWGIIRYVTAQGEEDKLTEGKRFIVFGLIGLFIMVAIWGVVRALVNQFSLQQGNIPPGPGDVPPPLP